MKPQPWEEVRDQAKRLWPRVLRTHAVWRHIKERRRAERKALKRHNAAARAVRSALDQQGGAL